NYSLPHARHGTIANLGVIIGVHPFPNSRIDEPSTLSDDAGGGLQRERYVRIQWSRTRGCSGGRRSLLQPAEQLRSGRQVRGQPVESVQAPARAREERRSAARIRTDD